MNPVTDKLNSFQEKKIHIRNHESRSVDDHNKARDNSKVTNV